MACAACGTGLNQSSPTPLSPASGAFVSSGLGQTVQASGPESGPPARIVSVPGSATAKIALFPDGRVFYSPDGYNLGGTGGATQPAYTGTLQVVDVQPAGSGIDTLFSDGSVFHSPDGLNLGGGGSSFRAFHGPAAIASITPVQGGLDVLFARTTGVYFSASGYEVARGNPGIRIYAGEAEPSQIVPLEGGAVVTLLANGAAYYSPDNRNLGGGGATVRVNGPQESPVSTLVPVGGGVISVLPGGKVFRSPDGHNLTGGGNTIALPSWTVAIQNAPFAPRDSAKGVIYQGHLLISGGYANPTDSESCWSTCSYFDLWASTDLTGTTWKSTPNFATRSSPDPRDSISVVNGGTQDAPVPTDFYDPYSPLIVWNGRLFALGSSVWSSADGEHWAAETNASGVRLPGPLVGLVATENSRAVQLGSTLYFAQPDTGEVYSTTDPDASSWSDLGAISGFAPRCGASVFALQGAIWIEGGGACDYSQMYNDIWSSSDGVHWTLQPTPASWSARMWSCVATGSDGVAWLVGGYAVTDWNGTSGALIPRFGANHSDVWYSKDGLNWRQYKADWGAALPDGTSMEPRHAPTCYIGEGSTSGRSALIVVSGTAGPTPDDASAGVSNDIATIDLPTASELP